MYRVIAFCGQMGSGKDTWGEKYQQNLKNLNYEAIKCSFAGPLKEEVDLIVKDIKNNIQDEEIISKWSIPSYEEYKTLKILIDEELKNNYNFKSIDRTPTIRKILQYWGSDVRRKQDKNYWINKTHENIKNAINENKYVFITDGRFENELEFLKSINSNLILLEVSQKEKLNRIKKRDNIIPNEEMLNHQSETGIKDFKFKNIVNTDNLELDDIDEYIKKYLI